MAGDSRPRVSWIPVAWTVACLVILGIAFFGISWPYVDVHNNLREATSWGWGRYVRYAFSRGIEYRPLLTLAIKGAHDLVGLHLWVYQLLVLAQLAAALALLLWLFRPRDSQRGLAAALALSCAVGLHTSRIFFLFIPLNAYSGALILLLVALVIALEPRARAYDWVLFPLTFVGLFTLESTLLIVPLVIALWWGKAPGVSWRGVTAMLTAVVLYLGVRFAFGGPASVTSSYVGSGLGFSQATPETLRNVFEHAPWLFWVYNVIASFLTVVASEPRAGTYEFLASLLRGETPFWQWLHVVSSLLTTILIAVALYWYRPLSERDRLLRLAGFVLIVFGSGLGFLYTRDRIGLSAGIGYALLLYVALSVTFDRLLDTAGWRRASVVGLVCALALAWNMRVIEAYAQLRDTAWDYHSEWTERWTDLGGSQPQTELLKALRADALRSMPGDPRRDPAWTFVLFERRFSREDGAARAPADAAADSAVATVSTPFDIRWKEDVDDNARLQLETELGLTDAQRVERDPRGRTWEYRLRLPTRDRVRAIVLHPSVDDTARIDAERFEIVQ
jgi:hypothetical protein